MKTVIALLSSLMFCGSGCASENDTSDAGDHDTGQHDDVPSSLDTFYTLLDYTHTTPVPRSLREVVADSSAIVLGSFSGVEDGRIIDYREGASNPMLTAVFEIEVQRSLLGSELPKQYAEFWRAPVAEIQAFKNALPKDTFVFILKAPQWDDTTYKFVNAGMGVPEGAILRAFDYPFGIVAQTSAGLDYPLMSDRAKEVFSSTTLEALAEEIASLD